MGYYDSTGTYRKLSEAFGMTLAQLKALEIDSNQQQGELVHLVSSSIVGTYYYHKSSVLTADDLFVIAPDEGPGRYLLAPGFPFDLSIAVTYAKADAAVLATAPTSSVIELARSYWEVTTNWTGGTSSAVGVSLDTAPANTQGDVLGGAGGDVAATLVASGGKLLGTIGAKVASGILLKGGVGVRWDRIVDAFTAGAGNVHLRGTVLYNPGA